MHKTLNAAILFCLMVSASQSSAVIGESPVECALRYGEPFKQNGDTVWFKKEPYEVMVTFYQEKAEKVAIKKPIPFDSKGQPFSDKEIQDFLNANSKGAPWKEGPPDEVTKNKNWKTENGQLLATYVTGGDLQLNLLMVNSQECLDRFMKKQMGK